MCDKASSCLSGLNWLLILLAEVQHTLYCGHSLWGVGGRCFLKVPGNKRRSQVTYYQGGKVSRTFWDECLWWIFIFIFSDFAEVSDNTGVHSWVDRCGRPLLGLNICQKCQNIKQEFIMVEVFNNSLSNGFVVSQIKRLYSGANES